jgi:hypothetical protein
MGRMAGGLFRQGILKIAGQFKKIRWLLFRHPKTEAVETEIALPD